MFIAYGIVDKDENTCYGISFPTFPGCVSAADTLEEIPARAVQALTIHIVGMLADEEVITKEHYISVEELDNVLEGKNNNICGIPFAIFLPEENKGKLHIRPLISKEYDDREPN